LAPHPVGLAVVFVVAALQTGEDSSVPFAATKSAGAGASSSFCRLGLLLLWSSSAAGRASLDGAGRSGEGPGSPLSLKIFIDVEGSFGASCACAGSLLLHGVGLVVPFLLRSIAAGDGPGRLGFASSLRRGGSLESSRFWWDFFPAVGLRAGGGGFTSRRRWRGGCRWSFDSSDAARRSRAVGSCGGFHAFGFLVNSGERSSSSVVRRPSERRREEWRHLWKIVSFAVRSLWLLCARRWSFRGVFVNGMYSVEN
jgi:hypothetical protein